MKLIVSLVVALVTANFVHAGENYGYLSAIITTDQGVINTDKLYVEKYRLDKGPTLTVKSAGGQTVQSDVPFSIIETITVSGVSGVSDSGSDNQWYVSGHIKTKDGRSFQFYNVLDNSILTSRRLKYSIPDPITGILKEQSLSYKSLKSIRFVSVNGPFMVDSMGKVYPPDYIYAPDTGEKLTPQRK
jgi:hypothetical protein